MALGANQIAAYAADLLDLDQQIDDLQKAKRDTYKNLREEHGKTDADALKRAVKLHRMGDEKRSAADAVDTEAMRMLAIIEAGHAPRATRSANGVPDQNSGVPTDGASPAPNAGASDTGSSDANNPGVAAAHINSVTHAADTAGEGSDALPADKSTGNVGASAGRSHSIPQVPTESPASVPVDTLSAADKVRQRRPYCQHADDLSKCAGVGIKHCFECLRAHAEEVGDTA